MPYRTDSIERYLADASAARPTPGGGSAASLAGAAGAAMACMAANFTVGRKRFAAAEPRVRQLLAVLEPARQTLLEVVDEDAAAYSHVAAALGMPKDTAEQRTARDAAMQCALATAMGPPLRAFTACAEALGTLDELADLANPNLLSDVGVAASLLLGALDAAQLNVEINVKGLRDAGAAAETRAALARLGPPAREAARKALDKVRRRIQD